MRKILRILSNAELMILVFFSNVIFTYLVLLGAKDGEFYDNLYYLSQRFDYIVMSIIGYNFISKKYWILTLSACTISTMRLINEILHITNLVQINNVPLLTVEFFILLFILWRTSKVTY
jgi:hypothetical protein